MRNEIHRVTGFEKIAPFTLRVRFGDDTVQVIDFRPVLVGEIYGPLADSRVFDMARVDEVAHTLVWPNGADFDPAILHDWPSAGEDLVKLARGWAAVAT